MTKNFKPMMSKAQSDAMEKRKKRMQGMDSPMVDMDSEYYYPQTISFSAEQLPEIKDWKVGEEYEVCIKVTMKSYEERNSEMDGKTKEKKEARFEVTAVKAEESEPEEKGKYGYVKTS